MEKRNCFYVSRKSGMTWLMALCLVCSAVARIVLACVKGTGGTVPVWSQIVLPVVATLLYALIALVSGKERFYKTAIPIWLLGLYFGLVFSAGDDGKLTVALYWVAIVFFVSVYTRVSAGHTRTTWVLIPLYLIAAAALLWQNADCLTAQRWPTLLPDLLLFAGLLIGVCAIRIHPAGQYHPTWGDRPDGRKLRSLAPMDMVSPYVMVNRNESSNLFADSVEITEIEQYVRKKRREGLTGFGLMHVLLASYVRTVAKYPGVNRFLSGQKVFSRGEDIQFCITVKKEMAVNAPETVIKVHLTPHDTAEEVYRKVNAEVEKAQNAPLDSDFDNVAHALTMIPGIFLKFTVWLLRTLDYFGLLPGFLLEVSPFHGSVYFTSMGSLGIPPIYHHLYNFGNMPVFVAFGRKRRATELTEDGEVINRKYLDFRCTVDERICDGYYYATFFKYFHRIMNHPEVLDLPPETVARDID